MTRQMPRLENGWVSIAGVVANDFNSSIWFGNFVSVDSLPDAAALGRKLRKRRPPQKAAARLSLASDAVGDDFDVEVALAWPVEFGEEDALPAAEGELAVFDKDELRGANKHGLYV